MLPINGYNPGDFWVIDYWLNYFDLKYTASHPEIGVRVPNPINRYNSSDIAKLRDESETNKQQGYAPVNSYNIGDFQFLFCAINSLNIDKVFPEASFPEKTYFMLSDFKDLFHKDCNFTFDEKVKFRENIGAFREDGVASNNQLGLVKVFPSMGIYISNGTICISGADKVKVTAKTDKFRPIVPYVLDCAIKAGLISNAETWSADDKANACATIGAATADRVTALENYRTDYEKIRFKIGPSQEDINNDWKDNTSLIGSTNISSISQAQVECFVINKICFLYITTTQSASLSNWTVIARNIPKPNINFSKGFFGQQSNWGSTYGGMRYYVVYDLLNGYAELRIRYGGTSQIMKLIVYPV